ncbi:VapA/VapB family virulence-associated protein [Rhodococcus hoagii]|nr:VapA/VapB family virulence-associated protein [Prescottella equi]
MSELPENIEIREGDRRAKSERRSKMKTLHKTVSKAIAATAVAAAAAMIPAGVANATVLDSGSSSAILNSGAGSGIVGSGSYDSSTTSLNLRKTNRTVEQAIPPARAAVRRSRRRHQRGRLQRFHVFGPEGKVFDGDAGGLTLPGPARSGDSLHK